MFKKTSDNQQSREVRKVESSRKNTGGVDPTAFKQDDPLELRDSLIARKIAIETRLSQLNSLIGESARRKIDQSWHQVDNWRREKEGCLRELAGIAKRLSALKIDDRKRHREEQSSFEAAFLRAARELLAKDVFNRIVVAATHMRGDSK